MVVRFILYQVLAKANLSADEQSAASRNPLFSEDISNKSLDHLTAKQYLESFGMEDQVRAKVFEEVLPMHIVQLVAF